MPASQPDSGTGAEGAGDKRRPGARAPRRSESSEVPKALPAPRPRKRQTVTSVTLGPLGSRVRGQNQPPSMMLLLTSFAIEVGS